MRTWRAARAWNVNRPSGRADAAQWGQGEQNQLRAKINQKRWSEKRRPAQPEIFE